MVKRDDVDQRPSSTPTTIKTSWVVLCSIPFILCSIILIRTVAPFSIVRTQLQSPTYVKSFHQSSHSRSEIKSIPNQNAEELLVDSLNLLQGLLVRISEIPDSDSLIFPSKNSKKKIARDLVSDAANFFGKLIPGSQSIAADGAGGGLGGLIGGFGNITNLLSAGAGDASKFLGIGLGNGTITGLDLPPAYVKQSKVTLQNPTGINLIAENLGNGLTSSLVGSINFDQFTSDPKTLSTTARALGQGAGNGAAAGLELKPLDTAAFGNSTGLPSIAGNLAQGLTSSFLGGVDLKNLLMSSMGNFTDEQANAAARSLAQGLGSGAAFATNLSNGPLPPPSDLNGINGIAGNLGQGLSVSFLQDIPFKQLIASNAPNFSSDQILDAAKGLGSGLAGGAVVGVGLQPEGIVSSVSLKPGGMGRLTENFGRGLSQSFLSNGTISKVLDLGQKTASNLNIASIAKGLAIGLVDGATTSFENAGGIDAIFNTDSKNRPSKNNITTQTSNFDDSVGGAAYGFGSGFGLQGTTFILQLLGKPPLTQAPNNSGMLTLGPPNNTTTNGAIPNGATPNGAIPNGATPNGATPNGATPNGATPSRLRKRQTVTTSVPVLPKFPQLNSSDISNLAQFNGTIEPLVQKAVDTLGCQGVGGLAAVAFSVGFNKGITSGSNGINELKEKLSQFGFAKQTITIREKESGNKYDVNIAEFKIKVNGNDVKKQVIILTLHIVLGIFAFSVVIPAILIIHSIRHFVILSGRSDILKNSKKIKWALALIIVLPSTIAVFALGVVGEGTKNHFSSAHGVLGLILTIFTLPAFPLALLAQRGSKAKLFFSILLVLVLALTFTVLITGFIDLSALTLCITQIVPQPVFIIIGIAITILLLQAITMLSIGLAMKRWIESSTYNNGRGDSLLSDQNITRSEEGTFSKSKVKTDNIKVNLTKDPKNFMDI